MPDQLVDAPPVESPAPPAERAGFRLAVFGAVLVLVLSAAFGIGRWADGGAAVDARPAAPPAGHDGGHGTAPTPQNEAAPHAHGAATAPGAAAAPGATTAATVGGLAVTSAGLTLSPATTRFTAGRPQPLRFRVLDNRGAPVTAFDVVHDKAMHLVVARRDLTGYQHLHPTMAPDGTWSVEVGLPAAGSWRAYADFTAVVGGLATPVTLGVDLDVAGNYAPQPLPAAARTTGVDGFTVSYLGTPRIGSVQPLLLRVQRDGAAVALEPYLGAYGHLVVLREGDLGYVHVHPEPELLDGAVKFWLAAPGPGSYRMFFDFQVAGAVHTAAFTATVS